MSTRVRRSLPFWSNYQKAVRMCYNDRPSAVQKGLAAAHLRPKMRVRLYQVYRKHHATKDPQYPMKSSQWHVEFPVMIDDERDKTVSCIAQVHCNHELLNSAIRASMPGLSEVVDVEAILYPPRGSCLVGPPCHCTAHAMPESSINWLLAQPDYYILREAYKLHLLSFSAITV
jgi:hypothetical protein